MAVVVSIVLTFIADNLMLLLFVQEYVASADILMIQIWSGIFISFLMVSNKWLLAENKTRFIFIRGLFGVIINIILNYIFIPIYGVNAAAFTSLITLIFTSLIIDVFTKDTRRHLHIKLCVFNPKLMKF
jgi:O-antigen/teichoic acid export membrane protein